MVDIKGLDKSKVLYALYEGSHYQGMGFLQAASDVTEKTFQSALDNGQTYFDYVYGKVMKVSITPDCNEFNECLYDRDCGEGHAQKIINNLRKTCLSDC